MKNSKIKMDYQPFVILNKIQFKRYKKFGIIKKYKGDYIFLSGVKVVVSKKMPKGNIKK